MNAAIPVLPATNNIIRRIKIIRIIGIAHPSLYDQRACNKSRIIEKRTRVVLKNFFIILVVFAHPPEKVKYNLCVYLNQDSQGTDISNV
jgi:hypothetical protein